MYIKNYFIINVIQDQGNNQLLGIKHILIIVHSEHASGYIATFYTRGAPAPGGVCLETGTIDAVCLSDVKIYHLIRRISLDNLQ